MDEPLSRITAATTQYYHQDDLGSVVAVTDNTGVTTGTERYDAFGNKLASTGAIPQFGYTGREPVTPCSSTTGRDTTIPP
jgi:uncharacterized protein RhaS with RHS repeats